MHPLAAALLSLFYLLTPPQDVAVCSLWLSAPATPENVAEACGNLNLGQYSVKFRGIYNDKIYCEKNATAIYAPDLACNFIQPLDTYRMEIVRKGTAETILCAIESPAHQPTRDEIAAACDADALTKFDAGTATIRHISVLEPKPAPAPACQFETPSQPENAAALQTGVPYTWLAGRLIWHGLVTVDCDGYSGLDPVTLAANECGLNSAADAVHRWQNRFDETIYGAAVAEGVPAVLLKNILAAESQFWPMWENRPADEIGLAQITPAAADMYLRWYMPEFPGLPVTRQYEHQILFIQSLKCDHCTLTEAIAQETNNIPTYARILRAYRCASTDWRAALVKWNGEDYAAKIMQSNPIN